MKKEPGTIKEFKDVMVGDITTNYLGETAKVVDKGSAHAMSKKYPNALGMDDWGTDEEWVTGSEDALVVEEDPNETIEGYTHTIYIYGYDGAIVYDVPYPTKEEPQVLPVKDYVLKELLALAVKIQVQAPTDESVKDITQMIAFLHGAIKTYMVALPNQNIHPLDFKQFQEQNPL